MAIRAASRSGARLDMHVRRQETVDIASIHDKQGGGREFGDSPHRPAQPTGPGLTFATAAPEVTPDGVLIDTASTLGGSFRFAPTVNRQRPK